MKSIRTGNGSAKQIGCFLLCAILCACALGCNVSSKPIVVVTPTSVAASHVPQISFSPIAPVLTIAPKLSLTPAPTISPVSIQPIEPVQAQEPLQNKAPKPLPRFEMPLYGIVIGVDPGHQKHSNKNKEPVAPGSSVMKKKVSSGTRGVVTGIYEYRVNLAVGLLLKEMLVEAGATVVMTHTKADVNISNVERAQIFNKNRVDLGVRLHCNGNIDQSVRGAFMLVPMSKEYPYYDDCVLAAEAILNAYGLEAGIDVSKGITYRSDQTGFNWCTRPIVNIEMGHMTNPEEDRLLTDPDFQIIMAKGIFNGIMAYVTAKAG